MCNPDADGNQLSGCAASVFNQATSTTYKDVSSNYGTFKASYGDGTTVTGPYSQDTLTIGNASFPNYVFGLITDKTVPPRVGSSSGIFGVAPQENPHTSSSKYCSLLICLLILISIHSFLFDLFSLEFYCFQRKLP